MRLNKHQLKYKLYKKHYQKVKKREITPIGIGLNVSVILTLIAGIDILHTQTIQLFLFLFPLAVISYFMGRKLSGRLSVKRHIHGEISVGIPHYYDLIIERTGGKTGYDLTIREWEELELPSSEMFSSIVEPNEDQRNRWDRLVQYHRWQWLVQKLKRVRSKVQLLPQFEPNSQIKMRMKLIPLRRGVLRLSGIAIAQPDPFNFYRIIRYIPSETSLTVYPKRYSVSLNELFSGIGSMGEFGTQNQIGEGDLFQGVREYRPGDPLKKIHWKSWAKRGKPIVKEFQQESDQSCSVIVDTCSSIDAYFKVEKLITLGASIAETAHKKKILLKQFWLNKTIIHSNQDQLKEILSLLAHYQFQPDEPFKALGEQMGAVNQQMGIIFWITTRWSQERQEVLQQLLTRRLTVRIFLLEGKPPKGGIIINHERLYGIQEGE